MMFKSASFSMLPLVNSFVYWIFQATWPFFLHGQNGLASTHSL